MADAVPAVAADTAFSSIIAQDMVLIDDFQCLPPVILADSEPDGKAGSCGPVPLQHAAEALKMRRVNLAHLDLRLDWYAPAVSFFPQQHTAAEGSGGCKYACLYPIWAFSRSLSDPHAVGAEDVRRNAAELHGRLVPDMLEPGSKSLPAFSRQTCAIVLGGKRKQLLARAFRSKVWQLRRAETMSQELFRSCTFLLSGVLSSYQRTLSMS